MTRPSKSIVRDGPVVPVDLGHRCYCGSLALPDDHKLGDHPPGSPKRPKG